jgi:hypothetical protein
LEVTLLCCYCFYCCYNCGRYLASVISPLDQIGFHLVKVVVNIGIFCSMYEGWFTKLDEYGLRLLKDTLDQGLNLSLMHIDSNGDKLMTEILTKVLSCWSGTSNSNGQIFQCWVWGREFVIQSFCLLIVDFLGYISKHQFNGLAWNSNW